MIIFNEKEYIESTALKDKDFKIATPTELSMVIRYYIDEGKDIREIREIIKNIGCGAMLEPIIDDDYVFTGFYMKANSRPIRRGEPIPITKYEYDFIRSVGDVEKEKILLALIVIQKIYDSEVFDATFKDVKKISLSQNNKDDLQQAIYDLGDSGHITVIRWRKYKINIDKMKVMKSEPYLYIDDFDRITIPYLKTLKTEDCFFCEWCGKKVKRKKNDSNAKRYCNRCSKIKNKYRLKS